MDSDLRTDTVCNNQWRTYRGHRRTRMLSSCAMPVQGRLVNTAMLLTVFSFVFISMTSIAVDGFLIPHRKNEVPDDLVVQQLGDRLRGHLSSDRVPDVKKSKKGISVNVVNVHLYDDQLWNSDSSVATSSELKDHSVQCADQSYCLNGGTCYTLETMERRFCECQPDFHGRRCESKFIHWSMVQCNATAEKVDCASYGVTRDQCNARGCCYTEARDRPEPWCYLPETSLVRQCRGREESRLQCGYYNIERDECNKLGCCWRPTSTSGTPWCYQADSENPQSADGGAGNSEQAPSECGVTPIKPNVNLRIVGGVEAVPHSWPWTVSLQYMGRHQCSGSLINDRWVLSSARCNSIDFNGSSIVVGAHDHNSPDPSLTERFGIEQVIENMEYLTSGADAAGNDILLIKLARAVKFNSAVLPVCLPRHNQTIESGTRCWLTGWGTIESGPESGSSVLNQIVLPLIDNTICNQPEWYNNKIDDRMVCTGYQEGSRNSCQDDLDFWRSQDDLGGPLVCNEDGKWILYGFVSWGYLCGGVNKPGLYGRTSSYVKWINRVIRENSG